MSFAPPRGRGGDEPDGSEGDGRGSFGGIGGSISSIIKSFSEIGDSFGGIRGAIRVAACEMLELDLAVKNESGIGCLFNDGV